MIAPSMVHRAGIAKKNSFKAYANNSWAPVAMIGLLLTVASCGGGGGSTPTPKAPAPVVTLDMSKNPESWEIGPIINGVNYSVGVALRPFAHPNGWAIDLPQPDSLAGHVHYVTLRYGSLAGKTRIVMRYRIEAGPGVQIFPRNYPGSPAILTLYFQRSGDDWSGTGKYEAYRWWATFNSQSLLTPGDFEKIGRASCRERVSYSV